MLDSGQGLGDARGDEDEGNDVGADHPLAVCGELTVAGGDEGGDGAEEPDRRPAAACGKSRRRSEMSFFV